jgi:hypothetical protein
MTQELQLVKIVHYDHKGFFSRIIRENLANHFANDARFNYSDITRSSNHNWNEISNHLKYANVFLCHPGRELQKEFFKYSQSHPDVKCALVIPGDASIYESNYGEPIYETDFPLFRYDDLDQIIKFCETCCVV